ncbi:MAG: hypothetical protein J5U19_06820 [Candidatus Methanoperedens sp.]|nr:hypothetical protein [Candidatus Methanoperedens sp.]
MFDFTYIPAADYVLFCTFFHSRKGHPKTGGIQCQLAGSRRAEGTSTRDFGLGSDTPRLISNMQEAMLGKLAEAKTASEFYMKITEAIGVLREYTRKVLDNECALVDMIFKTHISRGCDDYKQPDGCSEAA